MKNKTKLLLALLCTTISMGVLGACDLFSPVESSNESSDSSVSSSDTENGNSENSSVEEHTHDTTKTEAVEATCTESGNIAYWTCSGCGKFYSDEACTTEITLAQTVVTEKGHTIVYHEAVAATEESKGNIEYWTCSVCDKYFSDAEATTEIEPSLVVIPELNHVHNATKTEAKEADCINDGNIAYWTCSGCGKFYSDEACTTEITLADTVVGKSGHNVTKTEAVEATCTEDGNIAYWTCSNCGKLYSDEACTIEITLADTVAGKSGHNVTKTEAVEATCTEDGNIAYWTCSNCGKLYSDEACTIEITLADTVVGKSGHNVTKTEAVAATCIKDGNIAYWTCSNCGKLYSDEECTTQISLTDTIVVKTGVHDYDENGDCKNCDAKITEKGVTKNEDGSITLEGTQFTGAQYTYNIAALNNNYIAMKGEYGIGYYLDITFTGNNMPHVMFFADQINGIMTSDGGKGLLLSNGLYSSNFAQNMGYDNLFVHGPTRILNNGSDADVRDTYASYVGDGGVVASVAYSKYPLLTQKGLMDSTDTYKYTVGTYLDENGKIVVDVVLYNVTTSAAVYDLQLTTTLTESDVAAGSIVLYDGVKGSGTTTTFSYGEAYIPEPEIVTEKGATKNEDGSVTLAGTAFTGAQWTYNIASTLDNNYVALKGEYGIGTYIDITFTGNNMPHVMFFADQINGIMTSDGGNGLLLSNGLYSSNFAQNMGYDNLFVHGPTRILNNGSDSSVRDQYASYVGDGGVVASVSYNQYPLLTQRGLKDTTDNYKYTVGTYLDGNGKIVVDIVLYNVTTSAAVYDMQLTTMLTESDVTAGSIILYDGVKGKDTNTTFSYTEAYIPEPEVESAIENKGATVNDDGSVTLAGTQFTGAQWTYNIASTLDNNYIALKGEYGIGTYIDITFTGNNMPHVMFFADQINGIMTSDGGKGLLLSNGLYSSNFAQNMGYDNLFVHGPTRILNNGSDSSVRDQYASYVGDGGVVASVSYNQYPLLTQKGLKDSTDTYKYTVGTYLDENGKIVVDIVLYNITTSTAVYDLQLTTTLTESDVTAGSIVLYDGVKGSGTTTTFIYSAPYKKEEA